MKRLTLSIAAILLAGHAWADEITLRSGAKIVGRVVGDKPDSITVEIAGGKITLDKADIVELKPGRTVFDEFDEMLIDIDLSGGAREFYELGLWARDKGMSAKAKGLFQRAIAKDPNHEGARRALGFVRYNDQWLTREELNLAVGLVRHHGDWMTKAERDYQDLDKIEKKLRKIGEEFEATLARASRPRTVVYTVQEPRYPIIGIQPALGYEAPRFFPYYYPNFGSSTPNITVNVTGFGGAAATPAPAPTPPSPPAFTGPVSGTSP